MQIFRELAGYSYGRADIVRRAMSKKEHDVMERERQAFIHGAKREDGTVECVGAVANGVPAAVANEIFDEMSSFASYAFNKSHAAAYALVAYQTAWFRHHYPRQYMAALLTSVLDNTDKIIDYIGEAKKLGIPVLPPDVQESDLGFTVVGEKIRFGLLAVKNVGRGFIQALIEEREKGPYKNLLDFFERMCGKDLNRRVVESLIKCGALDTFGHNRAELLSGFEALLQDVEATHRNNVAGQMNLFQTDSSADKGGQEYHLPAREKLPLVQMLAFEKDTTGLYLSGHPLEQHEELVKQIRPYSIQRILAQAQNMDGQIVQIVGIVASRRLLNTKNNETMAFVFVEDRTASIEIIVFPRAFEEFSTLLPVGSTVAIRGKVKAVEDENTQIICEQALTLEQAADKAVRPAAPPATVAKEKRTTDPKQGLYLKFADKECPQVELASRILFAFEGGFPVYFYFNDTGKYLRTPKQYWIAPNDVMLGELRRLLGDENVHCRR